MERTIPAKIVMFVIISYGTATLLAASAVLHTVERFRRQR